MKAFNTTTSNTPFTNEVLSVLGTRAKESVNKKLSKSVEKELIVRINEDSRAKKSRHIVIKPENTNVLICRYKGASQIKEKGKESPIKQKSRQQSRENSNTQQNRIKSVETYTAGIRKEVESGSDSLNITGYSNLDRGAPKLPNPSKNSSSPLRTKILAQIQKSRQPALISKTYSNPSQLTQNLQNDQKVQNTNLADQDSASTKQENSQKNFQKKFFPTQTPAYRNGFSLVGQKKPMLEKENNQIKLNGRNIRIEGGRKGHICSRFIRRGNKPIMWCKDTHGDSEQYDNKKRRTRNGTLWVRRPKTPVSYTVKGEKEEIDENKKKEKKEEKQKSNNKKSSKKPEKQIKRRDSLKKALKDIKNFNRKELLNPHKFNIKNSIIHHPPTVKPTLKKSLMPTYPKSLEKVKICSKNEWKDKMDHFYEKVKSSYSSASPMRNRRGTNLYNNFLTDKITINKKDQNLAFWDFQDHFGSGKSLLDLTPTELKYYRKEYGETAVSQGYLYSKMQKRSNNRSSIEAQEIQISENAFPSTLFSNPALSQTKTHFTQPQNSIPTQSSKIPPNSASIQTPKPLASHTTIPLILKNYKIIDCEYKFDENYYLDKDRFCEFKEVLEVVVRGVCEEKEVKRLVKGVKIFYNGQKEKFICIFGRRENKLSKCCQLPMYIVISAVLGVRILCVDKYCPQNPVFKAMLGKEEIEFLNGISETFRDQDESTQTDDDRDGLISILLKDSKVPASAYSFTRGFSQETIKNKQNDIKSQFVSKRISEGKYKYSSLREINYE